MLEDLSALSGIGPIVDQIWTAGNAMLPGLAGLEGVTTVGSLTLEGNPALSSVAGLGGLTTAGELFIEGNPLLGDLEGLGALREVHTLSIVQSQFGDLDALAGLTRLSNLWLSGNPALASLNGLGPAAQGQMERIAIQENASLVHLVGLEGVTRVSALLLETNPSLESLAGLNGLTQVDVELWIFEHPLLTDVRALENLAKVGFDLRIIGNATLPACEVDWLIDSLGSGVPAMVVAASNDGVGTCAP
jgi:hypothetical protein